MIGDNNTLRVSENVCFTGTIELFGDENYVLIGDMTKINQAQIFCHWGTSVLVGSSCLFSSNIVLRTTDSHSILNDEGERINPDENVQVEDHVWLGRGVSVQKRSCIGHDSVVGSRALVSGEIPSNVVAGGVPATVIKEGVTWTNERL
jgi:acetyltransferase-like isoleucine patch superfamily enzyme